MIKMYCQMCLVLDVGILPMDTATLQMYAMLLEVPLQNPAPNICYECSALLRKYHAFKMKCNRAHNLLHYLETLESGLISRHLFEAHRKEYKLQSKLSFTDICSLDVLMQDDCSDKVENEICAINLKVDGQVDTEEGENFEKNEIESQEYIDSIVDDDDDTRENNMNELTNASNSDLDDESIPNYKNMNELLKKATLIANTINPKNDNDLQAKENHTSVLSLSDLVKRATLIANNMKANEGSVHSEIYQPVETNKQVENLECFLERDSLDGFATVVPLTPEATHNEILLRKKTKNYIKSPYKCELCYRGFISVTTFDHHMKKHSQEFGAFECDYCHCRFTNKRQLNCHIRKHRFKYLCDVCDYVSFNRTQARGHFNRHKGVTYKCNECDATFRHINTLSSHKRREHARKSVCALCGDAFISQSALQLHKSLRHRLESPALSGPHCAECAVQFASEAAYERHLIMTERHRDADPENNTCGFCGKILPDKGALQKHLVCKHTQTELSYECASCEMVFCVLSEYMRHMKAQHPTEAPRPNKRKTQQYPLKQTKGRAKKEKYMCEHCGIYVSKNTLQFHIMRHTGELPYKCEECGKGYTSTTSLYIHKESHVATRAYQCDECQKKFKRKSVFKKHLKLHTYRPYKCDRCDKRFIFPSEVNTHIKHSHNKVPWPAKKPKLATGHEVKSEKTD